MLEKYANWQRVRLFDGNRGLLVTQRDKAAGREINGLLSGYSSFDLEG